MNKITLKLSGIFVSLFLFTGMAQSDSIDGKRILKSATDSAIDGAVDGAVKGGFSELERQLIGDYFNKNRYQANKDGGGKKSKKNKGKGKGKGKQKSMPPGLAKRDKLPPGLQKQLERNGTLPPGLAKRNLPGNLASQLPPVDENLERVIADTSVLLVDKATGVIKDIIKDIVR